MRRAEKVGRGQQQVVTGSEKLSARVLLVSKKFGFGAA
jgi:hypothetical protein